MRKVGVIGHTGKLGKPLIQILQKHPEVEVVYTESRREGMYGNPSDAEIVFLALPYNESFDYINSLKDKKLIDLSIDHRADSDWVYGMPELYRDQIRGAERVANPGCYATSVILGLAPLRGRVSRISVSAVSGISGSGEEVKDKDNIRVYKEGRQHQHIEEMERNLRAGEIVFVPQRIDTTDRGIVSNIFAEYNGSLEGLYEEFYRDEPFVRMVDIIETANVEGTNYCDMKVYRFGDRLVVVNALDNLIKGGSGQAVQNFNIMYGFDEKTALE